MLNRLDHLKSLTNEEVRQWLKPRRARWTLAFENSGLDANIGVNIRGHNAFAGGGIIISGSKKWHKGVSMGTYHYEPIVYGEPIRQPLISLEADPSLPPCDDWLTQDACYVIGHDRWGLSPQTINRVDARLGPPRGWSDEASPGVLAHVLMHRLRNGLSRDDGQLPPVPHRDTPYWHDGWETLTHAQQRELLPMTWWKPRDIVPTLDWWVWMPDGQYSLNTMLTHRAAIAAGAHGLITPNAIASPGHRRMSEAEVRQFAHEHEYPIIGLEQGGEHIEMAMPQRGILVLGHERDGLSTDCDRYVSIPQWGSGRSMNVSMAGAIGLDAALRHSSVSADTVSV